MNVSERTGDVDTRRPSAARSTPEAGPKDFTGFVRARQERLVRSAYLSCGDEQLAQDLVQEALVKLAARWESVDHPEAFVRRVIYRDSVSWWRRWRRESLTDTPPEQIASNPADAWISGEDVRAALRRVPTRQRTALVLRYFDDLSEAQTAEVMGVRLGTVKSLTHLALARMRAELATTSGDDRQRPSTPATAAAIEPREADHDAAQ